MVDYRGGSPLTFLRDEETLSRDRGDGDELLFMEEAEALMEAIENLSEDFNFSTD